MCGYLLILILQSKIKFSEGSLVTSEEEKKKKEVEVSASPFNPDCVSCQFLHFGVFWKWQLQVQGGKGSGSTKNKDKGKGRFVHRSWRHFGGVFPAYMCLGGEVCVGKEQRHHRKRVRVPLHLGSMRGIM